MLSAIFRALKVFLYCFGVGYMQSFEMKTVLPPETEKAQRLAAKLNREKDRWLPLWVHSADTMGVAQLLFDEWLPEKTRQAISCGLNSEQPAAFVRAAAVLHDMGKATISFQTRITEDCEILRERLVQEGLSLLSKENIARLQNHSLSHAQAGEILLTAAGCPFSFAEVAGSHHGRPWAEGAEVRIDLQEKGRRWNDPRAVGLWGGRDQTEEWQSVQEDILNWMLQTAGVRDLSSLPEIPQTTAVLLSGLIIMADWIASNEQYFPLIPLSDRSPDEDMEARLNRGWSALNLPCGWDPCETDDWTDLSRQQFGFPPNKVQTAMLQAVKDSRAPGLMILEAPMGLGKTEAALLTANLLAEEGAGGIFFGLPTQATANAIFGRIEEWGEHQPETNRISIRLAHGMADMNEDYQALMAGSQTSEVEEDGDPERLVVHEWFRGRKQALLADFVVGTVDQVLMAALRQKHVMLRHLGLCGKVVIIDECHAYDAYMNQYLEETIRWLGSYHTPVIMLSATLPSARRADFMAAYLNLRPRDRKRMTEEPWFSAEAYPALTWTDGDKVCQRILPYDGPERQVKLIRVNHDDTPESQVSATASLLGEALKDGGCAAVILNTVRRAQMFAASLREILTDATVLLLHSRFVIQDRLNHEGRLLKLMGKKSTGEQRHRVVVVGTQVIEQSLDFDADVMISDLCPMDLLMQRMGRLHRHSTHDAIRPPNLREPKCYVLCAGEKLDRGAGMVYGDYLLMRTRAFLPESVRIPTDIPRLVNRAYDGAAPLQPEPEGYVRAKEQDEIRQAELKQEAKAFRIHDPKNEFTYLLEGDIPSDEDHAKAQVRAGEMSMDVLLLYRLPTGELAPMPWLGRADKWPVDRCPSAADARQILAQRIGLPAGLTRILEKELTWDGLQDKLAMPKEWETSPWLKQAHLVILDDAFQAEIGSVRLLYSEEMGMQWEREGETK